MPEVLPTINAEPPQGIQSILDTGYIWNPDVANELIAKVNELLEKIEGLRARIYPYEELPFPIAQYTPCYYGDGVYVAAAEVDERPVDFDPSQWIEIASKGGQLPEYLSVERLGDFLYKVTFDSIPEELDPEENVVVGSCSSFVRDGKLYRNFDMTYDDNSTFKVVCPGFEGIAVMSNMPSGDLDISRLKYLPQHIVDGVNSHGIMVSTHIVFNDWQYQGSGEKFAPCSLIPAAILNDVESINQLGTVLGDFIDNMKIPASLATTGYLMQFLVTDGTTTYAILPPTSADGKYSIQDITANPKLTNFRWVPDAIVNRVNLQDRPTGVERWNSIGANTTLENLRFTECYITSSRLSEFIGIDGTTKDSTDAELEEIFDRAHAIYINGYRGDGLWQTVHSVVYGEGGMEHLWCQENWEKDYISASSAEWGKIGGDIENQADLKAKFTGVNTSIAAEATARQTADTEQRNSISTLGQTVSSLSAEVATKASNERVAAIEEKIPSAATAQNQLADKDFVNSSIQNMAANYITSSTTGDPFATRAALVAGPWYYKGAVKTPTNNDYALVETDETHDDLTSRYMYDGTQWVWQYVLNDTKFTQAQLDAINSGITSGRLALLESGLVEVRQGLGDKEDIFRYGVLPDAEENAGRIVQYTGGTIEPVPATAVATQTVGSGLSNLRVDITTFVEKEQPAGDTSVDFVCTGASKTIIGDTTKYTGPTQDLAVSVVDVPLFISKARAEWNERYGASIGLFDDVVSTVFVSVMLDDRTNKNALVQVECLLYGSLYVITSAFPNSEEWGIAVAETPVLASGTQWSVFFDVGYAYNWTKGGASVSLPEYGVSYSGEPTTGDTITVEYTQGSDIDVHEGYFYKSVAQGTTPETYAWVQTDVQKSSGGEGIEWVTKIDLPQNYSGDRYSATPFYTIRGGLPSGTYEFYFATKTTNDQDYIVPIGEVVYKVLLQIDNDINFYGGKIGLVLNGDYMNDGYTEIFNTSWWSFVWKEGRDIILGTYDKPWSSAILMVITDKDIPECFKLSAIKNVETGETYIAEGTLEYPSSAQMLGGRVDMRNVFQQPNVPVFRQNNFLSFSDADKYLRISPFMSIAAGDATNCSELDISIESTNGGKYHIIVENSTKSYCARVLEASGEFTNTQLGYNSDRNTFLYLNQPNGTPGSYAISVGAKGSSDGAGCWVETPDSFTPVVVTKVGGQITIDNFGKILQYEGEDTSDYINGYFYKATGDKVTVPESVEFTPSSFVEGTVQVNDIESFMLFLKNRSGWDDATLRSQFGMYSWRFEYYDGAITRVYWGALGDIDDQEFLDCFTVSGLLDGMNYFYDSYTPGHTDITNGHWEQVNVQPGSTGGVTSVNGQTGIVVLDGEDISAEVNGDTDTIQGHLQTISDGLDTTNTNLGTHTANGTIHVTANDKIAWSQKMNNPAGGTAGQVLTKTEDGEEWADASGGASKNVITLTGESGTLTSAQIAQVLDDTAVLEIVCDGEVFRLSNKDSTLTYRTYINEDCALTENVAFKAIYIQLNSGAANYGSWSLEEVSAGGGAVDSVNGQTGTVVLDAADVGALSTSGGTVNDTVEIKKTTQNLYEFVDCLKLTTVFNGVNYTIKLRGASGSNALALDTDSLQISGEIVTTSNRGTLGNFLSSWYNTYTQRINNGADINVPTTGGTMAVIANNSAGTNGQVLTKTSNGIEWANAGGGVSDVKVNGTSVVTSGVANVVCPEIDDSSTASNKVWSASKLNTTIGNIESLLANI